MIKFSIKVVIVRILNFFQVEEARAKGIEDDTADKRAAEARAERCKKKGKKGRKADSSDDEEGIEVQETGERRKSSR